MTKTILDIMGTIFVVVGIAGFVSPDLGGTHLSAAHNVIHLVSGALALWFGLKGTPGSARAFSWAFGTVYGLLGVAGMVLGHPGTPMMHDMGTDPKLLIVIPNVLELGRNDHILHIVLGIVFIAAALMARTAPRTAAEAPPARS
jgi:hypothetical protein